MVEKDLVFNCCFQQVVIWELDLELSFEILCGLKECYELYYGVSIIDEVIQIVNCFVDCYISDCCLLDKVIDLIDEVVV